MAKGFAVKFDGEVELKTVSPREIGAMVNSLWVHAGAMTKPGTHDEVIKEAFGLIQQKVKDELGKDLDLVEVEVREVK